ncbi:ABC transporter permease [Agrococcus carbonis]|uniref:Putative ABC transport system permease protein n=1 Tax=Agrococcus carbonis TaxID=684552 RepID=A0A1H1LTY4_9MICO|nr:ABC transporter permease [Agrococcus carbonis]SDR77943.1 putative ABC transport system permease protein [Agrococcus carbonis]
MDPELWLRTAAAIALLAAIAVVGMRMLRVEAPWDAAIAVARAAVQLALLSVVLAGLIQDVRWVALGLVVMLVAAILTAAHRGRAHSAPLPLLAAAIVAGPAAAMLVVFGTGALELTAQYLLAIGGIVIGNAMTMAILVQRVLHGSIRDRWGEVEGWLALGATPRQSIATLARAAVRTTLLPAIDQTRTTGIVVLPGAFVGAVFAGLSPVEAGRFQLLVLAGILAAGVITTAILAFGPERRAPAAPLPRATERSADAS